MTTTAESYADRVLDAAEACFREKGLKATRMEDIARIAGISRPNLYRYFPDKEALILGAVLRHIDRIAGRVRNRVPLRGPSRALIEAAFVLSIEESRNEPDVLFVTAQEIVLTTARLNRDHGPIMAGMGEIWKPLLDHARRRGELRDDIDTERAVRWLTLLQLNVLAGFMVDDAFMTTDLRMFVLPSLLND